MYDDKIVDSIFLENESTITKEDFLTAIAGNLVDDAKAEYVFSP